jgi:hypothetical protein
MELNASIKVFVRELNAFSYALSSLDHVWNVLFPVKGGKWHHLNVNLYKKSYYISHVTGDGGCILLEPGKKVAIDDFAGAASRPMESWDPKAALWETLIQSANKWLSSTRRDWIKANKRIQAEYPLQYRYGVAPNALIRDSLPDIYRLDKELGKRATRELVRLVEEGFFWKEENTHAASMTADDYFSYCKIAYIAGKRKGDEVDESLSGREMYSQFADGRHEGLLDIDPSSAQEFADWIDGKHPKRSRGGHPWEIKRGGNTTHIDLAVYRHPPQGQNGFKIELRGQSIGRMVETMRMFLAIQKAGLPISIANPEGVRKRLLAQDNIGIIPSYSSLHRANQRFPQDQDVFDVMHYADLGRYKRRITPFIAWEPLPILKPKSR